MEQEKLSAEEPTRLPCVKCGQPGGKRIVFADDSRPMDLVCDKCSAQTCNVGSRYAAALEFVDSLPDASFRAESATTPAACQDQDCPCPRFIRDTKPCTPATTPAAPDAGAAERVAQIRQRLEAATPGPWAQCSPKFEEAVNTADDKLHIAMVNIGPGLDMPANATFIARAPEDIAYLLAQLQAATAARATAEAEAAGLRWQGLRDRLPMDYGRQVEYYDETGQRPPTVGPANCPDIWSYSHWRYFTPPAPAQTPQQAPPRTSGSGEREEGGEAEDRFPCKLPPYEGGPLHAPTGQPPMFGVFGREVKEDLGE